MAPSLVCTELTKTRKSFQLGPITTSLGTEVTCLVGANGAGKSTLMRLILGLEKATSGGVIVDGARSDLIGYLPQEPVFPALARVGDYLVHIAMLVGIPRGERDEHVQALLSTVDLHTRAGSRIGTLSGGMRRRLGLAQALIGDPSMLLLDEPTAGLDPHQRIEMRRAIRSAASRRVTLLSTHLVEDVADLAARVCVLREGQIAAEGSVDEIVERAPSTGTPLSLELALSALMTGARAS